MQRSGFTLIETLLVIAIMGVIGGVSVPMYMRYQDRSCVSMAAQQITDAIARARLLAGLAEEDSAWGFSVEHGVIFKGEDYETRDPAFDETYALGDCFEYSGPSQVAFEKVTGDPLADGEIVLNGEDIGAEIEVEQDGTVITGSDDFVICHSPPGNPENAHTIMVSENAWPAHQNHGDTAGTCPGDDAVGEEEPDEGEDGSGTCEDRFFIDSDGTIEATGEVSARVEILGSEITYGQGGPEVKVTIQYSKDDGDHWTNMFNNQDVDGGEGETVAGLESGDRFALRFRGKYGSFDRRYASNDHTGHVYVLEDGDEVPPYDAFDNQSSLEDFLDNIIDASGHIDIGMYDAVFLVEIGNLNSSASDFQDAVALVEFTQDSSCD